MSGRFAEVQLAFMMLTRLPAGQIRGDAPPLASCVWAFPLVGVVVGGAMALAHSAAIAIGLPPLAAALLAIAASVVLTGALHEDGLADTADGFGGGATVTRKLDIMRDSRIGTYGVVALILTLALLASAITAAAHPWAFVALSATSRTAMLFPMITLKPARSDGLGRSATVSLGAPMLTALAITLALTLLTGTVVTALVILLSSLAVTALARRQIGGQTGDVLGATQKLTECAGWLAYAARG
ncbi:MAG: adenosylcobinamide-GDP ribazoletransferase [Pseudomonadota bacterium]